MSFISVYCQLHLTRLADIENGWYFKQNENDSTIVDLYDNNDIIIQTDISIDDVTNMTELGYTKKFSKLVEETLNNL